MKNFFTMFCLSMISFTSAYAEEGYPMTCVFDGTQSVSIRPSTTVARKLLVSFGFKRATKPATQGVDPGTCAWNDRAVYQDEPAIMSQVVEDVYSYREVTFAGKSQLVLVPGNAFWAPQMMTRGYTLKVKVYNSAPDHGNATNFFKIIN